MIEWERLDKQEQVRLRDAFGHYLDTLPPSCSLDMQSARFQEWLSQKGIRYREPVGAETATVSTSHAAAEPDPCHNR